MRWFVLITIAVLVLLLGVAAVATLPKKLVYNPSESAPVGFYWIDQEPISRGDYVYVRAPERGRDLVIERGYLPPDVALLKRVVGLDGDRICRDGTDISINGKVVASALERDRLGRTLPCWNGCRVLNDAEVFLLQDHPQSFDGRYFGPLDRRLIIGRARLLRFPGSK